MAQVLLQDVNTVMVGLGTLTFTVPTTSNYNVKLSTTENPPSSLAIVVKKNGSTIYTAPTITPTQGALQFQFPFQATAADVITVVLSSSAAIDAQLNTVQTTVSIGSGLY